MVNYSARRCGTMINMRFGAMWANGGSNMCRTVVVVAIVSVIMWWLWFVVVAITVVYVVRRIGFVAGALAMADFAFVVWSLRIGFFLIVDAVVIVFALT